MSANCDNEINIMNYTNRMKYVLELIKMGDFVVLDATVETTGCLKPNEEFTQDFMSDLHDCSGTWYDNIKEREKCTRLMEIGIAIFKMNPERMNEFEVEVFNIPLLTPCVDDNELERQRGHTWAQIELEGHGQKFINDVEFDLNKSMYKGTPFLNRNLQEAADTYMKKYPDFMVTRRKRQLNPYLTPFVYQNVTQKERKIILERLKGFSTIIENIAQCNIPIVGHHLLLKLVYIYKDFIEYLPDTYLECKDKILNTFKLFYDTKYIADSCYQSSSLSDTYRQTLSDSKLYQLIRNIGGKRGSDTYSVFVGKHGHAYLEDISDLQNGDIVEEDTKSFCYEAGFDALASGLVFLEIISILQTNNIPVSTEDSKNKTYLKLFLDGKVTTLKNKMFKDPTNN